MTRRSKLAALVLSLTLCAVPVSYSVYITDKAGKDWLQSDYWQATLGGILATVIGIILGLPIAAWVNDIGLRRQQQADATASAEHAKDQLVRLCRMLASELASAAQMLAAMENTGVVDRFRFNVARWKAVSSSGDLRWVTDLPTISALAEAYEAIDVVNMLGHEWLRSMSRPDGIAAWPGTNKPSREVLTELLRDGAADGRAKVSDALRHLDRVLSTPAPTTEEVA
jgi:hypothetical protein